MNTPQYVRLHLSQDGGYDCVETVQGSIGTHGACVMHKDTIVVGGESLGRRWQIPVAARSEGEGGIVCMILRAPCGWVVFPHLSIASVASGIQLCV